MNEIVSFGDWVRQRRKMLGLTQAALAKQVGCAVVTVKKIEQDERRPSLQIARLLADWLQIPQTVRDDFIKMARGQCTACTPLSGGGAAPAGIFAAGPSNPQAKRAPICDP